MLENSDAFAVMVSDYAPKAHLNAQTTQVHELGLFGQSGSWQISIEETNRRVVLLGEQHLGRIVRGAFAVS
jgi:hypothetical protein